MEKQIKALSKREKNICEFTWGCIPLETTWVRESKLFLAKTIEYEQYKHIWE